MEVILLHKPGLLCNILLVELFSDRINQFIRLILSTGQLVRIGTGNLGHTNMLHLDFEIVGLEDGSPFL